MSLNNAWVFTETKFKAEEFLKNTGNIYKFVSQRPYVSKKDPSEKGVTLRLLITKDNTDYGSDKKTGLKRDSNTLNNFDVTILNGKEHINVQKGEYVRLIDFIHEKSFVIGFDLILRFRDVEKINVQTK
ncbi:hypothetical protein HXA31_17105 [Salipaludibacillus agaradhaerens]|jgi:hypothetical protein|uniref:Uncharacterized protein n=1 Tax=Salipaludibacillus agaradhaerens TaxID=76935 RepID=A0A9Q4B4S9_SALAG|nr:hypothetical protein [Salipaludibacillus agaradhaerens]MCR6098306.1 hypothetical protein [Salipaludibacillus agaradhaerens]MCR6116064.1 hypothetical protein [Salipaludibacillus agaradhaerens]